MRSPVDEVALEDDERSSSSTMPALPVPRQAARAADDAVAGLGPLRTTSMTPRWRSCGSTERSTAGSVST